MRQKVSIAVINPVASGISQTTGQEWKRQDIVVRWEEPQGDGFIRYQYLLATLHGKSVDTFAERGYQTGDVLEADIEFSTRSFGGRAFNDVRIVLD